jgi:trehalose-6-phosphate synthase
MITIPEVTFKLTQQRLSAVVARVTAGKKLVVVSNREPAMHVRGPEGLRMVRPASGMVTAIEPFLKAVGGTWVAHGSGSADRLVVDAHDRVGIPAEDPKFTLRRVWLTRKEENGYYYGLSNRSLWPLCHIVYKRPHFARADWEIYRSVNERFRDAVLEEVGDAPAIVFIQDYHLALLPRLLKTARPELQVIQFWHIPWPNREAFRIFPWGEELLDGMLGNDLLGFHLQYHCNNFLDTVDRAIEARVDYEHFRVYRGGHPTYVRPFPISVDFAQIGEDVGTPEVSQRRAAFVKELEMEDGGPKLLVGADRIDYTKGIPERLRAFDLLLTRHPEFCSKVTLVQLAAPSRTHVEEYRKLNEELDSLVDDINWRHQTDQWTPVRFLRAYHDYYAVLAACRIANVLLVTSLHDGMNLVAKEFVSARTDVDGVLLLSQYTGSGRDLADAVQVNPYDIDQMVDAMVKALTMPKAERRKRMSRMRAQVAKNTVYGWGDRIFEELDQLGIRSDAP